MSEHNHLDNPHHMAEGDAATAHANRGPSAVDEVEKDTVDTLSLVLTGLFGVAVTLVIIFLVQVLYYRTMKAEFERDWVKPGVASLKDMLSEQQTQLLQYKWVDKSANVLTIPVDEAMRLTVREWTGIEPAKTPHLSDVPLVPTGGPPEHPQKNLERKPEARPEGSPEGRKVGR